ncbi:MAG: aminotransferase class I/II-fold pyridoxal phosphate-dependent enzyme, partial [Chloroflexota bacterium]|nr:aminotransferase class I/II-fold pyridoxal phosphate-dependent enzyme [Chloroflexota bacterium]
AKQILYNICMAICDPGDEVLVPIPVWQTFVEQVKLAEGKPVLVELDSDHRVRRADLEPHITARTRAIFLNSPNNPTGVVMDPEEVRAVAELAVERGIYLIGDETYEHFLYGDATHVVPAALDEEVKRWTIEVNTVSKTYAMTGWRVGYAAGPAEVISAMAALMGQSTTQTASVSQWTAVEALTGPQDCVQEMVGEFAKRREYFISGLHRIGVECSWPEGAFYAYPSLPAGESSSLDFSDRLLTEAHIATVPGADFYGEGNLRLSYATSMDVLSEALERLERYLG